MRSFFLVSVILAGWVSEANAGGSYLYQPSYCQDDALRTPAVPYLPQPGDIFLATTKDRVMRFGHWCAGAASPHHSGIVIARPDGSLAILEAGPFNTIVIGAWDLLPHLQAYARQGKVWIRRRRVPLTPEQSAALTAFAMPQDGKPFAWLRIAVQLTPFRTRGPLRTYFLGKPHGGGRRTYFCSELVTECLVATGLIDAADARPSATYPRDLFYDTSPNPFLNQHFKLSGGWCPPARWTDCPAPALPAASASGSVNPLIPECAH